MEGFYVIKTVYEHGKATTKFAKSKSAGPFNTEIEAQTIVDLQNVTRGKSLVETFSVGTKDDIGVIGIIV